RALAQRLRPTRRAVPALRHPDRARGLHEPRIAFLPAVPAAPAARDRDAPSLNSGGGAVVLGSVRAAAAHGTTRLTPGSRRRWGAVAIPSPDRAWGGGRRRGTARSRVPGSQATR